jgi:hypothetical protein
MGDLLGEDYSLAEKNGRYRCLDKVLEHKRALFGHLRARWQDLFDRRLQLAALRMRRGKTRTLALFLGNRRWSLARNRGILYEKLFWPQPGDVFELSSGGKHVKGRRTQDGNREAS